MLVASTPEVSLISSKLDGKAGNRRIPNSVPTTSKEEDSNTSGGMAGKSVKSTASSFSEFEEAMGGFMVDVFFFSKKLIKEKKIMVKEVKK